jgi:hypothetical protein
VFDSASFDSRGERLDEANASSAAERAASLDRCSMPNGMRTRCRDRTFPKKVLDRMRRAKTPEAAAAEGIAIARDLYAAADKGVCRVFW